LKENRLPPLTALQGRFSPPLYWEDAVMGRRRTPTAVLVARGSFRKDPKRGRARENEPVVETPLGAPPAHLTDVQRKLWDELAGIAPVGVLTGLDRWAVEAAVVLMAAFRESPSSTKYQAVRQALAALGMTPTDRSKVSVAPKPARSRLLEALELR
jgi:hypothetical protein